MLPLSWTFNISQVTPSTPGFFLLFIFFKVLYTFFFKTLALILTTSLNFFTSCTNSRNGWFSFILYIKQPFKIYLSNSSHFFLAELYITMVIHLTFQLMLYLSYLIYKLPKQFLILLKAFGKLFTPTFICPLLTLSNYLLPHRSATINLQ